MTPEQQEFYEKLRDALALTIHDFFEKYGETPCKIRVDAMEKLHDLWPTLCDLDEAGKEADQSEFYCDINDGLGSTEVYTKDIGGTEYCVADVWDGGCELFLVKSANARPTISKAVGGGDE